MIYIVLNTSEDNTKLQSHYYRLKSDGFLLFNFESRITTAGVVRKCFSLRVNDDYISNPNSINTFWYNIQDALGFPVVPTQISQLFSKGENPDNLPILYIYDDGDIDEVISRISSKITDYFLNPF